MEKQKGNGSNLPAKKNVVEIVNSKVQEFVQQRQLHLPPDYSIGNAMKSAWLELQSVVDKDKKPALSVCTQPSIMNALLDMAVQGLNPGKKQGYFIVYGSKLVFQRSYFGTIAVAKRVAGVKEVYPAVVFDGDDFEYEIKKGNKYITKHTQKLENVDTSKIRAAYCIIEFEDGRPDYADIMTMDQIKKSWKKSKMSPDKEDSTHKQFTEEMCKRTVINRACKKFINSSSDSSLFLEHFNRAEDTVADDEVEQEIAENANSETIDIEYDVSQDEEPVDAAEDDEIPGEEPEPEPEPEPATSGTGTSRASRQTGQQSIGGPEF